MLLDNLTRSVKKMRQMDIVEKAALDAEKKAKNDADYKTVVGDYSNTMNTLQQAVSAFDYSITSETAQVLEECINRLDQAVSSGVVDAEVLAGARQQISRKINPGLSKEWKAFYQKKTKSSLSKLDTLGNLVGNQDEVITIRANIYNGSEWAGLSLSDDGTYTRLDLLKLSISKIDELEENLNLSNEVKAFIVKVTDGKARITDVTPGIIDWIKKENLDDRFAIHFRS